MNTPQDFKIAFKQFPHIHARDLNPEDPEAKKLVTEAQNLNESTAEDKAAIAYTILKEALRFRYLLSMALAPTKEKPKIHFQLHERKQPNFSGETLTITLDALPTIELPVESGRLFQPWSGDKFTKRGKVPIIDKVDPNLFQQASHPSFYNMLIRIEGDDEIKIPQELGFLKPLLSSLGRHALSLIKQHGNGEDFHFFLTVDTRFVRTGEIHRGKNPHVDSIEGGRYVLEKQATGWSYTFATEVGTTFFDQDFDLNGFNPITDNINPLLFTQAEPNSSYQLNPEDIAFMTSYDVHRGTPMPHSCVRTFVRFEVSKKIFDNQNDSINPAFVGQKIGSIKYPWPLISRDMPASLQAQFATLT